ncbi:MAG: metallophosphoesterase, partial [Candidatus Hodarchaeales archaeon]
THPMVEQEVARYESDDPEWARTLLKPHHIFIDEVDSFSVSTLGFLISIIRVFKWFNPFVKVILASATLGNPHELAKRFFGPEGNYEILKGTGRRGPLTLRIDYDKKPKELFYQKLQERNEKIETELDRYAKVDNYTPIKELVYLNHKISLNYEQAMNRFSQYSDVVHGWMKFDEIVEKIGLFRTDPTMMTLAITSLLQTSFDFPDVSRGLWYGTPRNPRDIIQLLGRFNRNPNQQGEIDIILRVFNRYEAELAQPEKLAEFLRLLIKHPDIPREQPWFTAETLKMSILWGLLVGYTVGFINGFSEVLEYIESDLLPYVDQEFFQEQLQTMCWELWVEGYINYNDDGKLIPTGTTKEWIYDRVSLEDNPEYDIILQRGKQKKRLGSIEYRTLMRHCLVGQYLYWKRKNYVILSINKESNEIYVESVPLGKHFFTNKLKRKVRRTNFRALDRQNKIALVDVVVTEVLAKPDKPMKNQPIEKLSPLTQSYSGVIIGENSPLLSFFSVESINGLVDHLKQIFHIESSELDLLEYQDPLIGSGALILDKSWIKLARLLFDYIQYLTKNQTIPDKDRPLKGISQINVKKFMDLPFAKGMNRLKEFLNKYQVVYMIIADFHINGAPFCVNGQPVDFREFCRALLSPLTLANTAPVKQFALIFLGDTYDWSNVKNAPVVKDQFQTLIEVLKELNLLDKTVFIRGNHDYSEKFFLNQSPLYVRDRLEFEVNPLLTATIEHGDNQGLEYYLDKPGSVEENILEWRQAKMIPDTNCRILGHTHDIGHCLKKIKTMLVPSLRRYCNDPLNTKLSWLGLFGYGNPFESECWDMAIDS